MDTASTLIGLGLLLLFLAPIFFLIYKQNKNNGAHLRLLEEEARKNKIELNEAELAPRKLMALDKNQKKLLTVDPANGQSLIIGLAEMRACVIETKDYPERPGKINFVSLKLNNKKNSKGTVEIALYDENYSGPLDPNTQLQVARKWEKIINAQITG